MLEVICHMILLQCCKYRDLQFYCSLYSLFLTSLLSPVVDEKAKEEEAYRQIKIKMRAEQLLAESDLPASMKRHAIHYTGTLP